LKVRCEKSQNDGGNIGLRMVYYSTKTKPTAADNVPADQKAATVVITIRPEDDQHS